MSRLPLTLTASDILRECPDCGLFQAVPALRPAAVARCPRCSATLRRTRRNPVAAPLALATTALVLFAIATSMPFLDLSLRGYGRETMLASGPLALGGEGMWEVGVVVLGTTMLAPVARIFGMVWVLAGMRMRRPPRGLHVVFRWVELLRPWSMVEVFLLGVFVAYTRLVALATVHVGGALYALAGLMLVMVAADAAMDPEAVWEELEQRGLTAGPNRAGVPHAIGCDSCGLVSHGSRTCPRCGYTLRQRKTNSLNRTWALLLAAALLYIPANILPVMTVISLGRGQPDTILTGVEQLVRSGLWPLALLVFFASITVPVLKLVGLVTMLIATHRGSAARLRERTLLYRIVDSVGRWSMIDVFMVSILTAIVRMGLIASIYPGPGVIAFSGVVILTMLAAMSFDPRLMWDAARTGKKP